MRSYTVAMRGSPLLPQVSAARAKRLLTSLAQALTALSRPGRAICRIVASVVIFRQLIGM
jgi:hypothetical protein